LRKRLVTVIAHIEDAPAGQADNSFTVGFDRRAEIENGGSVFAIASAIRMSARLTASHPDYLWLNRLHCVGIGQAWLERAEVAYDVYAVR